MRLWEVAAAAALAACPVDAASAAPVWGAAVSTPLAASGAVLNALASNFAAYTTEDGGVHFFDPVRLIPFPKTYTVDPSERPHVVALQARGDDIYHLAWQVSEADGGKALRWRVRWYRRASGTNRILQFPTAFGLAPTVSLTTPLGGAVTFIPTATHGFAMHNGITAVVTLPPRGSFPRKLTSDGSSALPLSAHRPFEVPHAAAHPSRPYLAMAWTAPTGAQGVAVADITDAARPVLAANVTVDFGINALHVLDGGVAVVRADGRLAMYALPEEVSDATFMQAEIPATPDMAQDTDVAASTVDATLGTLYVRYADGTWRVFEGAAGETFMNVTAVSGPGGATCERGCSAWGGRLLSVEGSRAYLWTAYPGALPRAAAVVAWGEAGRVALPGTGTGRGTRMAAVPGGDVYVTAGRTARRYATGGGGFVLAATYRMSTEKEIAGSETYDAANVRVDTELSLVYVLYTSADYATTLGVVYVAVYKMNDSDAEPEPLSMLSLSSLSRYPQSALLTHGTDVWVGLSDQISWAADFSNTSAPHVGGYYLPGLADYVPTPVSPTEFAILRRDEPRFRGLTVSYDHDEPSYEDLPGAFDAAVCMIDVFHAFEQGGFLWSIDWSQETNPTATQYRLGQDAPAVMAVDRSARRVLVAGDAETMLVVDVSQPLAAKVVATMDAAARADSEVALEGSKAYVVSGDTLYMFTEPKSPISVPTTTVPATSVPPTPIPTTLVPMTRAPPTPVPPTPVPATVVPPTKVPRPTYSVGKWPPMTSTPWSSGSFRRVATCAPCEWIVMTVLVVLSLGMQVCLWRHVSQCLSNAQRRDMLGVPAQSMPGFASVGEV